MTRISQGQRPPGTRLGLQADCRLAAWAFTVAHGLYDLGESVRCFGYLMADYLSVHAQGNRWVRAAESSPSFCLPNQVELVVPASFGLATCRLKNYTRYVSDQQVITSNQRTLADKPGVSVMR